MKQKLLLNLIILSCSFSLYSQCPIITSIVSQDPIQCNSNTGSIEFCGLVINESHQIHILVDGNLVVYTTSASSTDCATISGLAPASYEVLLVTTISSDCSVFVGQTFSIDEPAYPDPDPPTGIDITICGAADGMIEICGLEANAAYNSQIVFPNGSTNITSFFTNGFGCGRYINLAAGTYKVVDLQENSTTCITTLNAFVSIDEPSDFVINCPSGMPTLACGEPLPAKATTLSEFMAQGGTVVGSCSAITDVFCVDSPTEPDYCGPGSQGLITRTYTLTNADGNDETCVQNITYLTDQEAPVLDCDMIDGIVIDYDDGGYTSGVDDWINMNIGTLTGSGSSDCTAVTVTTDYIGMVPYTGSGTMADVSFFVTDACGNRSTCTEKITLIGEDVDCDIAIVCQGSVCLNLTGTSAELIAQSAVLDINPTCDGAPFTYGAARMVAGTCGSPGTTLSPTLDFCCDDIGTTHMVMIQVTDSGGSMATCMIEVEVKDVTAPTFTSCPSSQTIECTDNFDLNDLSTYGVATAEDECGDVIVTETVSNTLDNCGVGTVTRTFKATDEAGLTSICTQVLTIINSTPFDDSMIVWPDDVTITNFCEIDVPGPTITGSPTLPSGVCMNVLVEDEDDISDIGSGCLVIRRTWKVLDWCQFDAGAPSETYRWEYIQLIILENTIAPTFDACELLVEECGNEQTCMGMLSLSISATDDCTDTDDLHYSWKLTLEDGTVFIGSGNNLNGPYPYGEHTLIWTVDDGCGNSSTCTQLIHIRDCKPPQAVCLYGININLTEMPGMNPMVQIWASDFDGSSSDNCTPIEELEFAFDANFTQPVLTFDCSDAGTTVNIMMYVRDADGNVSFCKTYVGIQDNHNFCDNFTGGGDEDEVLVSGRVAREDNTAMTEVDVMIKNPEMEMHYMTDEQGAYAFENLSMSDDYLLKPDYEGDLLNGLTTLDIIEIQRHVLGLQSLASPYKIIAADINNSEHISGADIIELRKIILGVQTGFNNNSNWRFLESSWDFADTSDPFPISEVMNIYNLDHDADGMDFIGIKTGDVNNSAIIDNLIPETISNRSTQKLVLEKTVERGFTRLTVKKSVNLTGFQFALNSNLPIEVGEVFSSVLDLTEDNYHVDQQTIRFSWSASEKLSLEEGDVLLEFEPRKEQSFAIQQNDSSFKPEAYDQDLRLMEIRLDDYVNLASDGWEVYRNTPNPFIDKTEIPFYAPHSSMLRLTVFTVDGTLVYEENKEVSIGYQTWTLNGNDFGNIHGVLYYRLESGEFSSTQPFIKLR